MGNLESFLRTVRRITEEVRATPLWRQKSKQTRISSRSNIRTKGAFGKPKIFREKSY